MTLIQPTRINELLCYPCTAFKMNAAAGNKRWSRDTDALLERSRPTNKAEKAVTPRRLHRLSTAAAWSTHSRLVAVLQTPLRRTTSARLSVELVLTFASCKARELPHRLFPLLQVACKPKLETNISNTRQVYEIRVRNYHILQAPASFLCTTRPYATCFRPIGSPFVVPHPKLPARH